MSVSLELRNMTVHDSQMMMSPGEGEGGPSDESFNDGYDSDEEVVARTKYQRAELWSPPLSQYIAATSYFFDLVYGPVFGPYFGARRDASQHRRPCRCRRFAQPA